MDEFEIIKTEPDRFQKFLNFISNKVEMNRLKVKCSFYKTNGNEVNIFSTKKPNPVKKRPTVIKDNLENRKEIKTISNDSGTKLNQIQITSRRDTNKTNTDIPTIKHKPLRNIRKLNKSNKMLKKYLKILYGELDKELYNDNENNNSRKIYARTHKTTREGRQNETNFIDSVNYGKTVINNCILKNKMIYDIKPLNKSKQKGQCVFPLKSKISGGIPNDKTEEIFDYKSKLKKFDNKIKSRNQGNIIKIKEIGQIPLNSLVYKNDKHHLKGIKVKTLFGRTTRYIVRGETIKFLKTCYPVQLIRPLLSQKSYLLKDNFSQRIFNNRNKNKNIRKKFNRTENNTFRSRFNNDIKEINKQLKDIKDNINQEFKCLEEQNNQKFNEFLKEDIYY